MICPDCGCEFDEVEDPDRCPGCGWPVTADGRSPEDRELDEAGYSREDEERFVEEEDSHPW
jgi:DNA-directed RNA polymerase subunit RPC12/RpoP